jgi:ABC-type multidrug transport system fused ATPase/permease subunit
VKQPFVFPMRIWGLLKPFHRNFGVVLMLLAVVEVLTLASPFIFGKLLNGLSEGLSMRESVTLAFITLAIWMVIHAVEHYKAIYEEVHLDHRLDANLDDGTLRKVQSLSLGQHVSQHSGITQNVVIQGRQSLLQMVNLALFNILPVVARVIITVAALIWFNWIIGTVVFGAICLITWFSFFMNSKFWGRISAWKDMQHRVGKFRSEILRNLGLVQIQAQERRIQGEFKNQLDDYVKESNEIWVPYMLYASARESMISLVRFTALMTGIYLVFKKGLPVGDFVVIWMWTTQATVGINGISHFQRQMVRLSTEVRKYLSLLDIKPAIVTVANPIRPREIKGKIEFRNVTFSYSHENYIEIGESHHASPQGEPALRGVSFVINPGERVAFVGESGAGKSSVITLLARGYDPDDGQILIDGHDLRLIDLKSFREQIGIVEQNVKLFDNTLRYNVLFGLNGRSQFVTEEDLTAISALSRIDRFQHRLTNGWDTWIGENGVKLSRGERQRVGIARALIKNSPILILDEATSSLDAKNERIIKEAVREASEGRTTIIIAHRLSTVKDADRIFVMDRGSIVAEGVHTDLYETCEIYRELVESQLVAV